MGTLAVDADGSDEDDMDDMERGEMEREEAADDALLGRDTGVAKRKPVENPAKAAVAGPKHWTQLAANEWSTCRHTGMLKPPRAHYDHITKRLVLNMDHYCPWMANTVGYGECPLPWRPRNASDLTLWPCPVPR